LSWEDFIEKDCPFAGSMPPIAAQLRLAVFLGLMSSVNTIEGLLSHHRGSMSMSSDWNKVQA